MFNTDKETLKFAKNIIQMEIDAVKTLQDSLSEGFVDVCNLLFKTKGRVILTGIGKSGHIATKIASTLSSTGTPSVFVHPAEALHGDLGMIAKQDIVIAISNSGNTVELNGIINYAIRFDIPIVACTSNKYSELFKIAKYKLLLPKVEEACSLGLAPTTSTTNMLVLGDALAVTLLEMRGFSNEDFKVFHPGGSLGSKLLQVDDIMHTGDNIPVISSGVLMDKAIVVITSHKFGCVAVVDEKGVMIGMITDGDIRRHMSPDFINKTVDSIMNKEFIYLDKKMTTSKALLEMENRNVTNLFILEKKKPIGIIHIHDLLKLGVL